MYGITEMDMRYECFCDGNEVVSFCSYWERNDMNTASIPSPTWSMIDRVHIF